MRRRSSPWPLWGCSPWSAAGGDDDDDDDDDTDAVLASFDCTAIEQAEGEDSPAARRCWDDWMEQWGDR